VKEDYRSFQFGAMEGVQLVDTVGGERIRSKPEYLVGSPKLGDFEGFGRFTNLSNISKYRKSFRFEQCTSIFEWGTRLSDFLNSFDEFIHGGFPVLAPYNRTEINPQILRLGADLQVSPMKERFAEASIL